MAIYRAYRTTNVNANDVLKGSPWRIPLNVSCACMMQAEIKMRPDKASMDVFMPDCDECGNTRVCAIPMSELDG